MFSQTIGIEKYYSDLEPENINIKNLESALVHFPIHIVGDAGIDAFCFGNFTDGLTWGTAHVIEDYEIDGGGSGSCIYIEDTTRYLIIRNCTTFNAGMSSPNSGILLKNCRNVSVIDCNISKANTGIYLDYSDNNTLLGNNISNIKINGFHVLHSENNTISDNNAWNNTGSGFGIVYSGNNTLSENNAWNNTGFGFNLFYSENNTFSENYLWNNSAYGFALYSCKNNAYFGNNVSSNGADGISLDGFSNNNTFSGNNVSYNAGHGFDISSLCENNTITGNFIKKNRYRNMAYFAGFNTIDDNILIEMPYANFSYDGIVREVGEFFTFTDHSSGGYGNLDYQWNFGDGTANVTIKNPTHQFNSQGFFSIVLTITDSEGDISVYSLTVGVREQELVFSFQDFLFLIGIIASIGVVSIIVIKKRINSKTEEL